MTNYRVVDGTTQVLSASGTHILNSDEQGRLKVIMDIGAESHAINGPSHTGILDDNQIPSNITRDSELLSTSGTLRTDIDQNTEYALHPAQGVYYLNQDDSDVGGYDYLYVNPDNWSLNSHSDTLQQSDGQVLLESYITVSGVPDVHLWPGGTCRFHAWCIVDVADADTHLVAKIIRRIPAGTETVLGTITSNTITSTSFGPTAFVTGAVVTSGADLEPSDRIVVKVYAETDSNIDRQVTLYYSDESAPSHVALPLQPIFAWPHGDLKELDSDDHTQYSLVDGTRAFTSTVGGVTPSADSDLTTKQYVDDEITTATGSLTQDHTELLNIGTTTHTGIDAHIADSDIHFPWQDVDDAITTATGSLTTDHNELLNIGITTHTGIDDHITDSDIHPSYINDLLDVNSNNPLDNQVLTWSGAQWIPTTNVSFTGGSMGEWEYKGVSADTDPGSRRFKVDNSDATLITELYVSDLNRANVDLGNFLGNFTLGDQLYLQKTNVSDQAYLYTVVSVVDNTSYHTFTITYDDDTGVSFSDKDNITFVKLAQNISVITDHGLLTGLDDDDHTQYVPTDASRGFTSTVSGIDPVEDYHLATKFYADMVSSSGVGKAGQYDIGNGIEEFTVSFAEPMDSATYYLVGSIENQIDVEPAKYGFNISNTTVSGFDIELSDITDSANYKFNYAAVDGEVRAVGVPIAGPQGDQGIQGIQGETGDTGASGISGGLQDVEEDTSPELGGDLNINDYSIVLNPEPTTNQTANGLIIPMQVDVNDNGIGTPLYVATDGNLEMAAATTVSGMPCIALALETGTGLKNCLLMGIVRDDSWNWNLGGVAGMIYVSATTGVLTQTLVSGTGEQVQTVGYATHADRMYFNPQLPMVELA